jgi:2-hydroxy-3-keto-5-methylthiopentenyl-1-phosphate phosphatase
MKTDAPTLVFCDFDGTITDRDTTDLIWTDHIGPGWQGEIFPRGERGKVSMVERIGLGFSRVKCPPERLLEQIEGRIHIRSGFSDLVSTAAERGWHLRVLSCGLDFYIEKMLPPEIPRDCFIGTFDGTWRVALPPGVTLAPGEDYKLHVLKKRAQPLPGARLVYIGDGPSDLEPARRCDVVFAVRGSTLARLCRKEGIAFTEFSRFEDVTTALLA